MSSPLTQVGIHGTTGLSSRSIRGLSDIFCSLRIPDPTHEAHTTRKAPPQANVELKVKSSPGRGFGLFAVNDIREFTCIVVDDALLSLKRGEDLPQLWDKYSSLPPEHREIFDALSFPAEWRGREDDLKLKLRQRGHDEPLVKDMARVSSVFQANAFKTGDAANATESRQVTAANEWAYSLFPTIARINHSCTPNAHAHYNAASGQEIVCAIRDIPAGQEIEIAYFDLTMARDDRRTRARSWGFVCTCPACSNNSALVGDDYELALGTLRRSLATLATGQRKGTENMWHTVNDGIAMAESERYKWQRPALPRLYESLSKLESDLSRPDEEVKQSLAMSSKWQLKISGYLEIEGRNS